MASPERIVAIVGAGLIDAPGPRSLPARMEGAADRSACADANGSARLIRDELHALARHGLADDPDGAVARVSVAANWRRQ